MDLPARPPVAAAARAVVVATSIAWGLAGIADAGALIISELFTNALQHAPGTDSFEMELVRREDGLRISIADGSSIRPVIAELTGDKPAGRGMILVDAFCSRWGAEDHHGGKRVWVDIDE